MSNLIQIQEGTKGYGSRVLFDRASFAVNEGEHIGVIGPNGAGKTTLFKVLVDKEKLDSGLYVKSNKLRLGYLAQEDDWKIDLPLEEFLEQKCITPIWKLKQLGLSLGLTEEHFKSKIETFSGGFRMRSQLLYIIGCEPNLMLLDEPTNYLDLESLLILENFLQDFRGAFLLISHDREFLRRTTDHILEVEGQEITKYPGNIDDYFEQKTLLREQLEKQNLGIEAKRNHILDFVRRFGAKATKAKQAQSKLKQLNKLQTTEVKQLPVTAKIRIPEPKQTGRQVFDLRNAALGYGEKIVLSGVQLQILRGDRIGVVGVNGAGKSTLLKAMAGLLKPIQGSIEYGLRVETGYFAQHTADELNLDHSVYESLKDGTDINTSPQDILDLAGSLLFSKADTEKPIHRLSGGEKARVALGKILLKRAPFLILDEPTNHLDFNTVEALTQALSSYKGTLVIVSHDRGFIGRVSSKILEINNGKVTLYPGTYDEYVWSIQKGNFGGLSQDAVTEAPKEERKQKSNSQKFNYKEEQKRLNRQIRYLAADAEKIETRIEKSQARMQEIAKALNGAQGDDAYKLSIEADELQKAIDLDEYRWLQLLEEKESFQEALRNLQG